MFFNYVSIYVTNRSKYTYQTHAVSITVLNMVASLTFGSWCTI